MRSSSIIFYALVLNYAILCINAGEWTYGGDHGPSHWYADAPECNQHSQSPVDIDTKNALLDPDLNMLKFNGYEQSLTDGEFINNGHAVQLNFPPGKTFTLSGGGMGSNTYSALQLHFHWAAPGSTKGSEHTVDGVHYPVEMHIVHIKNPYTSLDEVKDMSDGLAVLGVFLSVDDDAKEDPYYQQLFQAAGACTYKGSKQLLSAGPPLLSLLPQSASFYRYSGSLTTPPCYQAVTWTVFQKPVKISSTQMAILQSLQSSEAPEGAVTHKSGCKDPDCQGKDKRSAEEDGDDMDAGEESLGGNYRPTQPLYGRIITSFLDIAFHDSKHEDHWNYHGSHGDPSEWANSYPVCGMDSQSPINIDSQSAKAPSGGTDGGDTQKTKLISFSGYDSPLAGTFINNGHSVQLNFADGLQYLIADGGLKGSYKALQLHFHWGEVSSARKITSGSEHTINGVRHPAEMHIVHAKTSYLSSLSDYQKNSSDAFTVLGIFVDVNKAKADEDEPDNDDGANPNMQKLIEAIGKVSYSGDTADFEAGPSLSSLLPETKSFYRYDGSLTTPPCSETVIWTLFTKPIVISLNQFIAFQQLFSIQKDDVSEETSIRRLELELKVQGAVSAKIDNLTAAGNDTNPRFKNMPKSIGAQSVGGGNETGQYLLRNNYRPLQPINDRTIYLYANDAYGEPTDSGAPVLKIVLFTLAGIIIFVVMSVIAMRCCCKKEKKSSQYTAATRITKSEVVDM